MKYRRVAKKLKSLGCYEIVEKKRKRGSHRSWYNPNTDCAATIPDHRGKDLKDGTLRAAINKLQLDWEEFNNT